MDISNGTISTTQSPVQNAHETHKHLKQERKLLERLKDARESVARARDRFQRAQDKLSRREARVARLERHLIELRAQLASPSSSQASDPTDQQPIDVASANGHALSLPVDDAQATQDTEEELVVLEILEAPELSSTDEAVAEESELEPYVTPHLQADTDQSSAEALLLELAAPVEDFQADVPSEQTLAAAEAQTDSQIQTPEQLQQPVQAEAPAEEQASTPDPVAAADSSEFSSAAVQQIPEQALAEAREEWNRANAAVHLARNRAQDMASSISTLVQTGLSGSLMEELLRKQAEANKALNEAQQHARLTYEQLVQVEANFQQQ